MLRNGGDSAMFAANATSKPQGVGKSQRYSMYWTLEKEIMLIKYFEQHRYMWDTTHILFHKREPRTQSFAELVELLGIDEGTIRQRWSSMRSQFCREERKVSLCPSYIPTWDHYTALQFLRKPNEERARLLPMPDELEQREEDEDDLLNLEPPREEPFSSESFDWVQLAAQMASKRQQEIKEPADAEPAAESSEAEANCTVKAEVPADFLQPPFSIMPAPSQLVRKTRTPRYRRWTPGYNKKDKIASNASSSISNTSISPSSPPAAAAELSKSSENEFLTQYIATVLDRFHPDKQRRCRNELLCVILKYDTHENDEIASRSPQK